MPAQYRYLIRPDGTIRVVSQSAVQPDDTDLLVRKTAYYAPSKYFWDFDLAQMVGYTEEQLAARKQAKVDDLEAQAAETQAKKDRIAVLMSSLTKEQAEVVTLLAELGGVPLT